MKKIFRLLIIAVLLLPIVVKADYAPFEAYYNPNVYVGDEVQLFVPLSSMEYGWEIKYDTNYLQTDKTMIKLSTLIGHYYDEEEDAYKEVENQFKVKVENGKIIFDMKIHATQGDTPVLIIKFKALKEGKTRLSVGNMDDYLIDDIIIKDKSCPEAQTSTTDCIDASTVTEEPKDDNKSPVAEQPKEEVKETNNNKNNDLFLYISLGMNLLLLVLVIALFSTRNKKEKETVAAPVTPVVAPEETVPVEPATANEPIEESNNINEQ